MADRSLSAESTGFSSCSSYVLLSGHREQSCARAQFEKNLAVFENVKPSFAETLCSRQQKRDMTALKPIPSGCVSMILSASKRNLSYKVAASVILRSASGQSFYAGIPGGGR